MTTTGKTLDGQSGWPRKAFALLVSIALAWGLAPAAAHADESPSGTPDAAPSESAPSIEGQAIVLYRVPDGAASDGGIQPFSGNGGTSGSDEADAALLVSQGLSVQQTWDFSAVDSAAQANSARSLSDGAESVASADGDAAGAIPTGSDLRIALVERDGFSTEQLIEELSALEFVEAVQPNYVRSVDSVTFDDTYYDNRQYSLHTAEAGGIDLEAALSAHSPSPAGENIVAVVDTGVDASHPDLAKSMWSKPSGLDMLPGAAGAPGYDFGDNDDDPAPHDAAAASHGTHCAGVIAAQSNNDEGIAGVAQSTKIMALKCSVDGASPGDMSDSAIVSSYQYIVAAKLAGQNVVAVNNSWAGPAYSPVLDYLVNQAGRAGVMSFMASGNDYSDTSFLYRSTVGLESPYAIVIASSNQLNDLSDFSNYNETQVDAAAPGSSILSTVSTHDAVSFFDACLSHEEGKELTYWGDLSQYEQDSCTIEGYAPDESGEYARVDDALLDEAVRVSRDDGGLRIDVNGSVLDQHGISPIDFETRISWQIDNPFKDSPLAGSDFAATAGLGLSTEDMQNGVAASWALEVSGDSGENLSPSSGGWVALDNVYSTSTNGLALAGIDTESDMLSICVAVSLFANSWATLATGNGDEADSGGDASMMAGCSIENVGIGRITGDESDYVPYAYMSGTSMATPVASGSYALMASLLPNKNPLELRGRLLGTTDEMKISPTVYGQRVTATDGRINLAEAMSADGQSANANTWSASPDAENGVTVLHGYALKDALVAIDGEPAKIVDEADDGSWIAVETPAAKFDGEQHRFDATDAETGRVYKAAYTMPVAEGPDAPASGITLERVMDAPDFEGLASIGSLVGAANGTYYADPEGAYLYYCADPQAKGATWDQRTAPGTPPEDETLAHASAALEYAYLNGSLFAFCARSELDDAGNRDQAVYAATYSIADDEWTPYQLVERIEGDADSALIGFSVAAYAGKVYCYSGITTTRTIEIEGDPNNTTTVRVAQMMWAQPSTDGSGFDVAQFESGVTAGMVLYDVLALPEGVVGLGVDKSGILHAVEYDTASDAWSDGGAIAGSPVFDSITIADFANVVKVSTGSGIVVTGFSWEGLGDTSLIAHNEDGWEWNALGSFGTSASEGITITAGGMANDALYLAGIDARTDADGSKGGIFMLPSEAAAQLAGLSCTASASAGEGGTAEVRAPFAEAGENVSVRTSDTATWTATPAQGYAFTGWYDASETLVSAHATYAMVVLGDVELEARFSPATEQPPSVEESQEPPSIEDPQANDANEPKSLAAMGDATPLFALICASVCATAIAAYAARAARRRIR